MAKRNYKATEASNKHIREIAPIEFPGSKTFDVYEGFEADVEFYFEKYNQDVKDGVNDPNVDVVEYIAGRIDEKYPTENPMQFDSLIGEVRALLPKIDKDWYANMYNPKRVKEGKEQMKESEMSSSYVKQLETDRRYYERTADGHWEAEDWTIAGEYYARANFLLLLEKYYAAKLNNDTEGELKAAEVLYKVYTDPEFLLEKFYIKKDKEEDKRIYQRAIKPGFLKELKNWNEDDTLVEGIYPDAYDQFVSETLPEIEKLLGKGKLKESKLSEAKESANYGLMEYQDEDCDPISYACYTLDEEGDEVDRFAYEFTYKDAIEACKEKSEETGMATHAVLLYDQNDDDDEEGWAFLDRVGCGPYEVVYTHSPKLTESKLSDLVDKAKEDIREYILMCKDREDKFSGKKSFELSNKFLIENLSNTYMLPENFLEELFNKVESELIDEGNSFWWKSEVWQESKTQNRKQRIKEDSLDDPDIDLSQSFKGKDLEFLEGYQNEVLDLMREIISSELEEIGFKRVRFFSKDGYKLYSGGIFSKKVAEPGSNIYVTIEIGEFGKIEADRVSYNAEDLANELCKAIEYYAPLLPVKVDAVYKAGNSGIDSAQWKIRLYHEVPEDILGPGKSQDSKEDQVRNNLTESSSNDELSSDEKSIVEEIIQADFESGLTSNDRESVLDMFKEDDVLSDKAEAATEYYFELLEYGPAGILEVITDNWSDDYLAEYGEFDDEDCDSDDEDCGDWETEKSVDINSTADWYKVSQIEGLMYMHKGMTAEEAKEVLGIDPSYVYVPSGNLEK